MLPLLPGLRCSFLCQTRDASVPPVGFVAPIHSKRTCWVLPEDPCYVPDTGFIGLEHTSAVLEAFRSDEFGIAGRPLFLCQI